MQQCSFCEGNEIFAYCVLFDGYRIEIRLFAVARALDRSRRETVSRNATTLRYKRKFCLNLFITHQLPAPALGLSPLYLLHHVCPSSGEFRYLIIYCFIILRGLYHSRGFAKLEHVCYSGHPLHKCLKPATAHIY